MQPPALPPEISDRTKMKAILAYDTMSSALWAAHMLTDLLQKDWGKPELTLSPWSFEVIGTPAWTELAANDTLRTDMIVLSTSSVQTQALPLPIMHWLGKSLRRQSLDAMPAVIAFFRAGEIQDGINSPRLQEVQQFAEQAGCSFFAPYLLSEASDPIGV